MIRFSTKRLASVQVMEAMLKHEGVRYTKGAGPFGLTVLDIECTVPQMQSMPNQWADEFDLLCTETE